MRELSSQTKGFTLIELSIVLVIIGLIVGGVLVGQDLIRAAAVRAQITQIEKFNAAANTFFGKYGYLPGDIPNPPAASFGFEVFSGGINTHGDGNGVIEGASGGLPNGYQQIGETIFFWADLTVGNALGPMNVNLIEGNYASDDTTSRFTTTAANAATYYPPAKLGQGNSVYVYSTGNVNYFGVAPITTQGGASGYITTSATNMTVLQAYLIDKKIDDGFPASGSVMATWATGNLLENAAAPTVNAAASDSSTSCYNNSTPAGVYSITINNGANSNCALSFKMQAGD